MRFLYRVMETPDFIEGNYNTEFIAKNMDFLMEDSKHYEELEDLAMIASLLYYRKQLGDDKEESSAKTEDSNWKRFGRYNFNRF